MPEGGHHMPYARKEDAYISYIPVEDLKEEYRRFNEYALAAWCHERCKCPVSLRNCPFHGYCCDEITPEHWAEALGKDGKDTLLGRLLSWLRAK